mmetsp:Transcript_9751/g.5092  ORF Transcript_9751/g.5092 Transcript_9751/m.5092 type:complete len:83 (+) Transcript_9751:618-866(+)
MIEPEIAFADLEDNMHCAESYLKSCLSFVMENNYEDLEFFDSRVEKGLIERLRVVMEKPFSRMTYTEAIDEIHKAANIIEFK